MIKCESKEKEKEKKDRQIEKARVGGHGTLKGRTFIMQQGQTRE